MNSRNMKNYAQSVEIFPAQSVEIFNERRISTTQVDEACEDTSDRNQCDLREIHNRFCETYRSQRVL